MHIETTEDLEEIVTRQNAAITAQNQTIETQNRAIEGLGLLVERMDGRIKLLTALLDSHHETLVKHGWAPARPIEKTPQVN